MAGREVTLHGNSLEVTGLPVENGQMVPEVTLTGQDMQDVSLREYIGSPFVLSVVPSLDTPVCSTQTKKFNEEISPRVKVVTVSRDLPFAQKRWCGAEGVEGVVCLSDFKHRMLGKSFGLDVEAIGLLARAVFVINNAGEIVYSEYVKEISDEPDYGAAAEAVAKVTG